MKYVILFYILFVGAVAGFLKHFKPVPSCPAPVGWAYADSCIESPITPPLAPGQATTQCFYFKPTTSYSTLSYIIGDFNCGPFAPYSYLTYELYDENCDSLIYSGSIIPTASNNFIWLDTSLTYLICYSWTALCDQFSACPIINPSYLPLTWMSVQAKYITQTNTVKIGWATASEMGCSHFIIERNSSGQWFEIGQLPAKGNTTYTTVYSFEDERPEEDNYYRIRQVDFNGVFTYSKVVYARGNAVSDCYYTTMLGVRIPDLEELPKGIYIRRCQEHSELITITE